MRRPARRRHRRRQLGRPGGGATSAGYAGQVTMLVRGDSLEKSMSHYLIEQIAAPAERRRPHRRARRSPREGEDGHLRAPAHPRRRRRARRSGRRRLLRLHRRRAAHRLARRRRRARRARLHPRRAGRAGPPAGRSSATRTCSRRRVPGVFVAGDVRARSIKRVASAVGEGSMAVSLDPRVPGRRMTHRARPSPTCARSTCSTTSTTSSSPSGPAVAEPFDGRGRRDDRRAGRDAAGRAAAARGRRRRRSSSRTAASSRPAATHAPTWMGAIARAHRAARSACAMRGRGPTAALARSSPRTFRRLALRPADRARPRHAPGRAGDEPHHRDRAEPRAARVARHDGGRPRARAQQPGRRRPPRGGADGRGARGRQRDDRARSSSPGSSATQAERARRAAAARRVAQAAAARRRSTRSTPPTPRTSCSTASRSSASPSPGGWPSRSRPPGVDQRRGSTASHALAGPATDAALALGGRVADRARPRRPSCRSRPSAMSELVKAVKTYAYMDRGELVEVDLHEGLETHAAHARAQAQAHRDRGRARLRPQPAEADRPRLRAQPGVDEPARQRDRRARRARHDHDHDAARRRLRDRRHRRRRAGHPATATRSASSTRSSPPRRSGSGTGLGLATARRIVVDRHDGSLTFDSEPGRTTFHVSPALHPT